MPRFLIPTLLLFCVCCKQVPESASNTDSLAVDTTITDQGIPGISEAAKEDVLISFNRDYQTPRMLEPFKEVYEASSAMYRYQSGDLPVMTHRDSVSMDSAMNKAYELILRYKDKMKAGVTVTKETGRLPIGTLGADDESSRLLRDSPSKLLDNADFTFIGAQPFMGQDPETYKDLSGNPETRYHTDYPANAEFLFNYIYSRNPGPVEITYGQPLSLYDGGQLHVKQIGSLNHNFQSYIPAWFLTYDGMVPGRVVSVELNLGEEYGCVTNLPSVSFGCSKNLDPSSIIGVFVGDDALQIGKGDVLPEVNKSLIEYDLDGDGSVDLAQVVSTRHGEVDEGSYIVVAIWYVWINGKWEVLDFAEQPECT